MKTLSQRIVLIAALLGWIATAGSVRILAEEPVAAGPAAPAIAGAPVNVRSFGATGDGVTDDSAGIQAALDSLRDGGALYFPKGRYAFGRTLVIPSQVRIYGDNKRSTLLLYTGSDRALVSGERDDRYGTGSYYLTIENITVRGADLGTGLFITSRYMTVSNVELSHFAVGIDAQACWTNKFYNVSFFYNGIAFKGGAFLNANSFVNCIFSTGRIAVTFIQGWNVSFVGCQFEGYTEACFSFNEPRRSAAIWNLNISGCYFENPGKCFEAGPNCAFYQLSLTNNIITTRAAGPAFSVNSPGGSGRNAGVVENNTFFRDAGGSAEPFVHLEGPAYLIFRHNLGYAAPGNQPVPLLDDYTKASHAPPLEETLTEPNRLNVSGTGSFSQGLIVGAALPATIDQGLLIYDNGKLRIFLDASRSEYLLTNRAGPSSARPTDCAVGMIYFDTTLNRPIWWNGTHWVDARGKER
jgi:hypothetical protein